MNAKKLLSLLLAVMMVFAISTAMAAKVTLPTKDVLKGHTFSAFQIFTGKHADGTLSDIAWGNGIDSTKFVAKLKTEFSTLFDADKEYSPAEVAEKLATINSKTDDADKLAKAVYACIDGDGIALSAGEVNNVPDGYYLIKDTTTNPSAGTAMNTALLQVVGDISIEAKTDAPKVEKKVKEDDKYNQDGGYGQGYNDVADYNIGETVPFKLIGTVPDMSRYTTYKYQFEDTLSNGLTLNESSFTIYASDDKVGTNKTTLSGVTPSVEGQSFKVTFDNLKETLKNVSDANFIIVEYTATLNTSAEIGLPGNTNTVKLTYSNNPNEAGEGTTPEDKVIVFTYEMDTTKTDVNDATKKLKDAEFVLMNDAKTHVAKIVNGKFDSWVEDSTITNKGTDGTYPTEYTLKSNDNGLFTLTGLDAGTYYLKETKAPSGYNTPADPFEVVITATTQNGQNWTSAQAKDALTALNVTTGAQKTQGTGDTSTGIVANSIGNAAGSTLPETGGMGTTLLYVGGVALVAAAAILLIFKKRMSVEK